MLLCVLYDSQVPRILRTFDLGIMWDSALYALRSSISLAFVRSRHNEHANPILVFYDDVA